jgi:hypothetical protein
MESKIDAATSRALLAIAALTVPTINPSTSMFAGNGQAGQHPHECSPLETTTFCFPLIKGSTVFVLVRTWPSDDAVSYATTMSEGAETFEELA